MIPSLTSCRCCWFLFLRSIFLPTKIYPHDYYPSQHHIRILYANCNSPTELFYTYRQIYARLTFRVCGTCVIYFFYKHVLISIDISLHGASKFRTGFSFLIISLSPLQKIQFYRFQLHCYCLAEMAQFPYSALLDHVSFTMCQWSQF